MLQQQPPSSNFAAAIHAIVYCPAQYQRLVVSRSPATGADYKGSHHSNNNKSSHNNKFVCNIAAKLLTTSAYKITNANIQIAHEAYE